MMNTAVLLLCLCGFALLGSLPFTFFRRGTPTAGWWLTAAPFFADAALLVAALAGGILPIRLPANYAGPISLAAVPMLAASIALIGFTIGVHRAPVSMWHQRADTPSQLVTSGPYAHVRHPFYAAFIMLLAATVAAFPHPVSITLLGIGTLQLYRTARREEKRLLASPLGASYSAYMARTGRLLPRFVGRAPARLNESTCSTDRASSPAATPQSARS